MLNFGNSYKIAAFSLIFSFSPCLVSSSLSQRRTEAREVHSSVRIQWTGQPNITLYRLQLARDEKFSDIVFDRKVVGREYIVTDLPFGNYYWRVAPAAGETGRYSPPQPIQITAGAVARTTAASKVLLARANTGWRTATGSVAQPIVAHLRTDSGADLVGVNSDGMVYALDGASGTALWAARFRPAARRGEVTGNGGAAAFTPIVMEERRGLANLVVAFDGGVRAVEGSTGRELWRASLQGRPSTGAAVDMDATGTPTVFIVDDVEHSLVILRGDNGKLIAETKLEGSVIGAPVPVITKEKSAILLALDNGTLDMRTGVGARIRAVKFDTKITTPPLIVLGPHGTLAVVGTERGLLALDANELKPLGRVATESDAPRGTLMAADFDHSGAPEIVMITRRNRVVVVNTSDGKIKWFAEGATDANSATFADLDGDGVLDVVVAAGPAFAVAFSGKTGDMIWQVEDELKTGTPAVSDSTPRRSLVITSPSAARFLLVGTDAAQSGLRALELPKNTLGVLKQ